MKKDLFLLEDLELIIDIDFEHSRSFQNDLGHFRILWSMLKKSGTFLNNLECSRMKSFYNDLEHSRMI